MPDVTGLDVLPSTGPLTVTFAVRPDEIELAFASNGDSLRHRLLLALIAELTTVELADTSHRLDWVFHESVRHPGFFLVESGD